MEDYSAHLRQLPNFIQAEIAASLGPTHGFSYLQIISRYKAVIDWLISKRRSEYVYHPESAFGPGPLSREEVEVVKQLADSQNFKGGSFFLGLNSTVVSSSIVLLTTASNAFGGMKARAEAAARQLAQQQAAEAAHLHAQRQAEEAARQLAKRQAEAAARQLAQRKAEEAARQKAKREAEKAALQKAEAAARLLAKQKAEQAALLLTQQADKAIFTKTLSRIKNAAVETVLKRAKAKALKQAGYIEVAVAFSADPNNAVPWIPGPNAIREMELASKTLQKNLEAAISHFAKTVTQDMSIKSADAVSAMLNAMGLNSQDVKAA